MQGYNSSFFRHSEEKRRVAADFVDKLLGLNTQKLRMMNDLLSGLILKSEESSQVPSRDQTANFVGSAR